MQEYNDTIGRLWVFVKVAFLSFANYNQHLFQLRESTFAALSLSFSLSHWVESVSASA